VQSLAKLQETDAVSHVKSLRTSTLQKSSNGVPVPTRIVILSLDKTKLPAGNILALNRRSAFGKEAPLFGDRQPVASPDRCQQPAFLRLSKSAFGPLGTPVFHRLLRNSQAVDSWPQSLVKSEAGFKCSTRETNNSGASS
jgi:hypothetical protein